MTAAHGYGGLVFHDVITCVTRSKAAEAGVDGLILVCAGAGGHAGTLSPFALLAEVRRFFEGTILLSGAIANGPAVLAAQAIGADLAYMGTRFIATRGGECETTSYKQMLVESSGEERRLYARISPGSAAITSGPASSAPAIDLATHARRPAATTALHSGAKPAGLARHLERRAGGRVDRRCAQREQAGGALEGRIPCSGGRDRRAYTQLPVTLTRGNIGMEDREI